MYCLRQTALGAQTKSDRPSSPTQTHCKHSHLELQIQLEEWIHLPVLLDKMLYKVQYTFNTLFCTSLFLSGFAYIFMLFSEKITSACKKLNKESEHKNFFFYTYIYIHTHIFLDLSCLTHTNVSDHLQKPKNIEILEINYKTKKL